MIGRIAFTIILSLLFLTGCNSNNSAKETEINFKQLQATLISTANFENSELNYLTDINTAQEYGISLDDIEEGFVYSTKNENPNRLVLAKTKGGASTENVEKSLANEVANLITSWKDNVSESKKLSEHVLKTKNDYVILIISENSAELEDEFDNSFI